MKERMRSRMSKQVLTGVVVGAKCDKTIKVMVSRMVSHKMYKKIVKKRKNYVVHDEYNRYKCGDVVQIREHIPISATKRWVVI
ncbi:30S ribosomal protein S17 [Ehrlichia ruminantium]|uniref:Small ribosomal subunit protein uS17 n=3 Tax=Ehrlichia ruminantium TaxID=779 RepID=RS17_EHRRG|nr:30S ribosomal protein S17 [Ehrlichia ruminantium]Q5FFU9.1 RecName: Full=Small ribosomal subunit protein uS17; AltName: Full=30S ribosomal protein S17 [Ehrlichia ruminantium str. Gardel]Q5HAT1.2 RecName: Full=Small ribosomal subunit protein uS17; AltName: Full=30S ribosomal protein S17 [Ehrlichia ruminantium str. Welgevonden]KYW91386.1 30S ribosomal protein S17 [Ehrlichia ruminantium]QLK50678.1 30S ribosomal protein S17 [Ehrlichia ruminantium]QLK51603.1 30S ribosomal protein S17 [Ehrlichia r